MVSSSASRATVLAAILLARLAGAAGPEESAGPRGELRIEVSDAAGKPLPCRIHLTGPAGKPVEPPALPFWRDHFVCDGKGDLQLPVGAYRYEVERGPEHERASGSLDVKAGERASAAVPLGRIADLAKEGWYSGDLHVHRPVADVPLLARAEDLHVAPVITWWNQRNLWEGRDPPRELLQRFDGDRFSHLMGGEDEREGGALLYFGLEKPLEIAKASREHPSPLEFAARARTIRKDVWIDIEKPFWWDVPTWVASGLVDSIGIANNHMCRSTMYPDEAWGHPRDKARLPDPLGNGFWTQEIYYHLLDCGIRLPPTAGSASGVLPNPVGYNRVYVHLHGPLEHAEWWAGLKAGRSFVTNGPLLLVKANGELPGHVFRAKADQPLEIDVEATIMSNDRVPRIEVVKDGRVDGTIPVDALRAEGKRAKIRFARSGWFLVRAIADEKRTFRFASTAPFWVEFEGAERRISKASAEFFLRWVDERIERVRSAVKAPEELAAVLAHHERARDFWRALRDRANAE